MESIKRYFRNALIGLATLILSSLSVDSVSTVKTQIDENRFSIYFSGVVYWTEIISFMTD